MKKQDNESLIQEIQKRLDWYTMEASDEEFDADEVQNLLKLLDGLRMKWWIIFGNIVQNVKKRKEFWQRPMKRRKRKSIRSCIIFRSTGLL